MTNKPQPSLLHGDLWSGNAGSRRMGRLCSTRRCTTAIARTDLAMTELFGGFPREFYGAPIDETSALDADTRSASTYNLTTCSTT